MIIEMDLQFEEATDSQEVARPRLRGSNALDEKVFWVQFLISLSLGILTYYLLILGFPFFILSTIPLSIIFSRFVVTFWIYFTILLAIPFLIFRMSTQNSRLDCFKRTFRTVGTQLTLYFVLCGIMFMVNI